MKQTVEFDQVQAQMRPGVITQGGLLGTDGRKLVDILTDDDAAVRRLGVTHASIAARMRELMVAGERGLGEPIRVADRFEITVDGVRGYLPCPFGHKGLLPKTNVTVRNLATGEEITFTELGIHMIEAHGFYEGRGAAFRNSPATLVRVLECSLTGS